jgi:hypothetical protein
MFPGGLGTRFAFAEVAALICPRALCVEHGTADDVIAPLEQGSAAEAARIRAWYEACGQGGRFSWRLHGGWHAVDGDDAGIDFLLRHLAR